MNVYKFLIFSILFFISYDNASTMKLKGERWKRFESLFADRSDEKRMECFKYLFNWRNANTGNSLLHHVAQNNDIEFVAGFIGMGWPINKMNAEGKTPLDLAEEANHVEVCELLQINQNLFASVCYGNFDGVQGALKAGAYVDVRDSYGNTPLILAAGGVRSADIVELLLSWKACVNSKNNQGSTALYWAAFCGLEKNVERLLATGADKTTKDSGGKTALDVAKKEMATIQGDFSEKFVAVIRLLEDQST